MVYAEFGGQTECIMGNWKIENATVSNYKTRKIKSTRKNIDASSTFCDRLKNNLKSRLFETKKMHQNYGSATKRTEANQTKCCDKF